MKLKFEELGLYINSEKERLKNDFVENFQHRVAALESLETLFSINLGQKTLAKLFVLVEKLKNAGFLSSKEIKIISTSYYNLIKYNVGIKENNYSTLFYAYTETKKGYSFKSEIDHIYKMSEYSLTDNKILDIIMSEIEKVIPACLINDARDYLSTVSRCKIQECTYKSLVFKHELTKEHQEIVDLYTNNDTETTKFYLYSSKRNRQGRFYDSFTFLPAELKTLILGRGFDSWDISTSIYSFLLNKAEEHNLCQHIPTIIDYIENKTARRIEIANQNKSSIYQIKKIFNSLPYYKTNEQTNEYLFKLKNEVDLIASMIGTKSDIFKAYEIDERKAVSEFIRLNNLTNFRTVHDEVRTNQEVKIEEVGNFKFIKTSNEELIEELKHFLKVYVELNELEVTKNIAIYKFVQSRNYFKKSKKPEKVLFWSLQKEIDFVNIKRIEVKIENIKKYNKIVLV